MSATPPTLSGGDLDADFAQWLQELGGESTMRENALARLHGLLLRIARGEVHRRAGTLRLAGPELDDLAYQAAADALLAITAKLDEFRGESRFTTWAYRFVILEVSTKIGRHFWRRPTATMDPGDWGTASVSTPPTTPKPASRSRR